MKKVCVIIFLIGLLPPGYTVSGQNRWSAKGDSEAALGQYQNAILYYKNALNNSTYDFQIYKKLGECYRLSGDFENSLSYYEKCMISGKFGRKDSLLFVSLLLRNSKFEYAGTTLKHLLDRNPDDPEIKRMQDCCRFAETQLLQPDLPAIINIEQLNSPLREDGPAWFGNELIFTSTRRVGDFLSIDKDPEEGNADLFIISYDQKNNKFRRPGRLSGKINTLDDEGDFTFSPSSQTAYFSRRASGSGVCNIYTAKYINKRWQEIRPVHFGPVGCFYAHPALSSDGSFLFFVSDMPGGKGGKDIWKARVDPSGTISRPVNAGASVNTEKDETFPGLAGDTILFFSSDGHTGMGGQDIFMATIHGNQTGKPYNMGAPVNSTSDDYGLLPYKTGNGGFFCSDRISGMNSDIFSFSFDLTDKINRLGKENRDSALSKPLASVKTEERMAIPEQEMTPLTEKPKEAEKTQVVEKTKFNENQSNIQPAAPSPEIRINLDKPSEPEICFGVQILATTSTIDQEKTFGAISEIIRQYGLAVKKVNQYHKYIVGHLNSREEAVALKRNLIGKGFSDCFIVIQDPCVPGN